MRALFVFTKPRETGGRERRLTQGYLMEKKTGTLKTC